MRVLLPILIGPVILASSCSNSGDEAPRAEETQKPLSERLGESNGYQQDSNGNWVPRNDKRSSFESQGESPYFNSEYRGKAYSAGEYQKKSWSGSREHSRQSYEGNTDGSQFQQSSQLDGQTASENLSDAQISEPYKTTSHATSSAREASAKRWGKPSDAETDIRRREYQPPEIIDWSQQRGITLDQSRGILGR